jgi:signal transduction histidine kinase
MTPTAQSLATSELDECFAALRAALREQDYGKARAETTNLEHVTRRALAEAHAQALAVAEANAHVVELTLEFQNLMTELEAQNDDLRRQCGSTRDARLDLELQSAAIAEANVQAVLETEAVREQLSLLQDTKVDLEQSRARLQARAAELSQEAAALAAANAEAVTLVMESEESREKAQAILREREEQLRQAQKMECMGQVAGDIARDFDNLFGAIIGQSSLILTSLDPEDPYYGVVSGIKGASERGMALVDQILAFCRCQELNAEALCLNDVIQGMRGVLRGMLVGRSSLRLSLADELGQTEVDPAQIEQVLISLTANARDAMPDGGQLRIETTDRTLDEDHCQAHPGVRPGRYVLLKVTDTGCGIEAEQLEHVFEPFFTTKAAEKRSGLGLSTVFGIVKQSGGDIQVHSEPGQGASFEIYLPVVSVPDRQMVAV